MSVEGIRAGQEGIAHISDGVDAMTVALGRAEEVALLAEEVSHRWRRFAIVIVAIGIVVAVVGLVRSRRSGTDDGTPEDG